MSGVLTRRRTNEAGVTVRYTPCAKSDRADPQLSAPGEEEDEEDQQTISILHPSNHGNGLQDDGPPTASRTFFSDGSSGSAGSGGGGGSGDGCSVVGGGGSSSNSSTASRPRVGYRVGVANRAVAGDEFEDYIEDFDAASDNLSRQGALTDVSSSGRVDLELAESARASQAECDPPASRAGSRGSSQRSGSRRVGNDLSGVRVSSTSGGTHPAAAGPSVVPVAGGSSSSTNQTPTANGPRHLPGLDLFPPTSSDRTKLIGERLSSADKISLSSPIYSNKVVEQQRHKSQSRQSLLEVFSNKLDRVKNRKRFSIAQGSLLKKPRLSEANLNINRVQRRQRRKDIEEKFGKRKSIRGDRLETATTVSTEHDGCNWTFVFDPSGRLCYWWSSVVSVAFLYNFWVIIYRFAFQEINSSNIAVWFTLDYTADLLYALDIAFHFRTGYLEDGVLQTDPVKLRIHYTNTTTFYIDCLCLLPLDFLYLSIGFCSILRGFRLVKVYRFWAFLDRTERHTNYPNVIRAATLMHYVIALFHWNACLYYLVATRLDRSNDNWRFPKEQGSVALQYLHALHWSLITLTTSGTPPLPRTIGEYLFVIFELIFSLVLFATFLGHIANIVTNVSAARKEFQARLDAVKTYMNLRRVPLKLQDRVIKWFDYLWMCNKSTDEDKALSLLPDKLKAEIAIHVHLDTLKRVEIFQNTEAGFLCELVLRLRPVLFSPGDYICRNGEVGKEMYIVNRGRLHVVADNGKTVLATLKPGSYFGEISILNMGTAGNRRTASVRSVGYSDLFCLAKKDLWDVLKEYPAARVKLEAIAVKRLAKYKKQPLEKALERSKSTPGLVESTGKVPLDAMLVQRHHTLPAGLLSSTGGHSAEHGDAEAERLRKLESTQSEDNLLSRCVEKSERRLSSDSQHQIVCNLTTSMTISSMTSYNGTPPLRSPAAAVETTKSPFTPPSSPKQPLQTTHASSLQQAMHHPQHLQHPYAAHVTNISGVSSLLASDQHHPLTSMHPGQQQLPFPAFPHGSFPYVSTPHVQAMTYLSPFSGPLTYPPPSPGIHASHVPVSQGALAVAPAPHLASSQTNLFSHPPYPHGPGSLVQTPTGTLLPPPHSPHAVSPLMAPPGSNPLGLGSPARGENQADILLKEISRLRERLAQLEGENTALTVKLNQQQWDVENRLMELELHLGQSDSIASTDISDDRVVTASSSAVDRYGPAVERLERGSVMPSVGAAVNKESII